MIEIVANDYTAFQRICQDFNILESNAIFLDPKKKRAKKKITIHDEPPERTVNKDCSDWVFYNQNKSPKKR